MGKIILRNIPKKFLNAKFAAIFFGIVVVLMIVTAAAYFNTSSNAMKKEFLHSTYKSMEQVCNNLNSRFRIMENITEMVFDNATVQEALGNTQNHKNDLSEYRQLENLISGLERNSDVHIRVYINDDKLYATDRRHFYPMSDAEYEAWYNEVYQAGGKLCWIDSGAESLYESEETVSALSCARMIKSKSDFKRSIGIIKVDIPFEIITGITDSLALIGGNSPFIMDCFGKVTVSSDIEMLGQQRFTEEDMQRYFTEYSGIFSHRAAKGKNYTVFHTIPGGEWYIAADIPESDISRYRTTLFAISGFSIIFLFLIGITVIIIYIMYSSMINRKIREIVGKIETGGIEVISEEVSTDGGEIGGLEDRVDKMLFRVNEVMKAYYDAQAREQEALMAALQAQVNPHFLYNTLDAINWVAIKNNNMEISQMLSLLARYFRLSLGMGKSIVTIGEELELIKVYMKIQEFRFANKITITYDIEEGIADYLLPKMTMQPILENAIIHGICKNSIENGHIDIRICKEYDKIYIQITDDGAGTDNETLNHCIHTARTGNKHTRSGYGLHNVHERAVLFSDGDEACGIRASSSEAGTEIIIIIKAKRN